MIEDTKRLLSGLLEPIYSEKILGLAEVKEVQNGTECGIGIKNYLDIKPGDIIENFEQKEEKRSI